MTVAQVVKDALITKLWGNSVADAVNTAWTICTSGTRPVAPTEGAQIYETDTDRVYLYTGGAWALISAHGAYETFTPTLTQSATPTKTVTRAAYHRSGRRISGDSVLTLTGAGTASNNIVVGLPVAMATTDPSTILGYGWLFKIATGFLHFFTLLRQNSTSCVLLVNASGAAGGYLGTTGTAAALASGDVITYSFDYEASAAS